MIDGNDEDIFVIDGVRRIIKPMIFRDVNIEERAVAWPGALNGNTRMGCSINVLRFLDTIDDETANTSLLDPEIVHPQEGTSIETIITYFNNIFELQNSNRICIKFTINIPIKQKLTETFNHFNNMLEPHMCIIVRYGRAASDLRPRKANGGLFSAGHYVIVGKRQDGTLTTVDPQNSISRDYDPATGVSNTFWQAWSDTNKYIDISILCVYNPDIVGGSLKNAKKSGAYVVPKNIMKQFEKALINSVSCSLSEKSNIAMPIKNTQRYKKQSNISRGGRRRRRQNKTHVKLKIGAGTKLNP
uniref:Uncharacterized protein n=1 Tax=viral metagenome TaxID=1070528 RepID=A0A6C0B5J5_9ZZZZ